MTGVFVAALGMSLGVLANAAMAQQNLDAGKTPAQMFSSTCSACHKSTRGLLRNISPPSLPSFLRQHYTTSSGQAQAIAGYLSGVRGVADAVPETPAAGPRDRRGRRPDGPPPGEQVQPDGTVAPPAESAALPQQPQPKAKSAKGRKKPEPQDVKQDGKDPVKPAEEGGENRTVTVLPATPVESKPVEAKPGEAKPAETAAGSDGPSGQSATPTAPGLAVTSGETGDRAGTVVIPNVPLPPPVTSTRLTVSEPAKVDTPRAE